MTEQTHCGYIAFIGRPNVGKSTLLNNILGQKLSITSRKPQTTRHRLLGIKTEEPYQFIYVDTPGFHQSGKRALNRMMNRAAQSALTDVDIIVWMVDATKFTEEDAWVQAKCIQAGRPLVVVVNKVDLVPNKDDLLPLLQRLQESSNPVAILPLSARKGSGVAQLEKCLKTLLPEGPFFFPDNDLTDRSQQFILAEFLREKVFRFTSSELPYSTTVQIDEMKIKNKVYHISAIIWVERDGQKAILLGVGGEKMKTLGREARLDMERFLGGKVFLQIWIKVKAGWTDNDSELTSLGFRE